MGRRTLTVSITVEGLLGASAVSVAYGIPEGWEVLDISDAGQWDAIHRKVKWGPFLDNLSRTVTFTARALTEDARMDGFSGIVPVSCWSTVL